MSITSNRRIINTFSEDYDLTAVSEAAESIISPGDIQSPTLVSGNNTITPPANAVGVTIIMPSGNLIVVTLKGVNGDTGIALHLTDPTSLGFNSTNPFVLNCSGSLTGMKLIWS